MSMNDDFGKDRGEVGSDSSQTAEDATLRGTPIEDQPGLGEEPTLADRDATEEQAQQADPSRLGEGLPDSDDLPTTS